MRRTLMSALLAPAAYDRIRGAPEPEATRIVRLLRGLGALAKLAATRPATFAVPRALRPALSCTPRDFRFERHTVIGVP